LHLLIQKNDLRAEDIASAVFTVTDDLDAVHPPLAARSTAIGWSLIDV
jgi:chorismate mutase